MSMIDLHRNEVLYKLAPAAVAAFFFPWHKISLLFVLIIETLKTKYFGSSGSDAFSLMFVCVRRFPFGSIAPL